MKPYLSLLRLRRAINPSTSTLAIRTLTTQPAMTPRVIDAIKQDHRELEGFFNHTINAKEADERTRFQNIFTWELARHSVSEELVVYPALEKHLANGKVLADKDREEHQTIKQQLKIFQDLSSSSTDFIPTITTLMQDLLQHIKEEELTDLPQLENAISQQESEKLSKSFERTKIFVPSRSHPSAPNKPPFETAVGLMTAPIDQIADLFRKWPSEKDGYSEIRALIQDSNPGAAM